MLPRQFVVDVALRVGHIFRKSDGPGSASPEVYLLGGYDYRTSFFALFEFVFALGDFFLPVILCTGVVA